MTYRSDGQLTGTTWPELASRWQRLVSGIIDAVTVAAVVTAAWIPALHAYLRSYRTMVNNPDIDMPSFQAVTPHVVGAVVLAALASACFAIAYHWLLTDYWGATIGKRALGIRVVASAGRSTVGHRAAFIRALTFVASAVIPFVSYWLLYFYEGLTFGLAFLLLPAFFAADILALFGKGQRQCLHDKAARTVVVVGSAAPR
jgi:uncharacterized RDD family membrane protein YckC